MYQLYQNYPIERDANHNNKIDMKAVIGLAGIQKFGKIRFCRFIGQ